MSALDEIREFAEQTPCRNSEMHKQCTRQDRDRLLAAVEGVLGLVDGWHEQAGPDSEAHRVYGPQVVSVGFARDEVHKAITTALGDKS